MALTSSSSMSRLSTCSWTRLRAAAWRRCGATLPRRNSLHWVLAQRWHGRNSRNPIRSSPRKRGPSAWIDRVQRALDARFRGHERQVVSYRFGLSRRSSHDVHELGDLAPLIGFVAALDRMVDTMRDVIAQDFLFNSA